MYERFYGFEERPFTLLPDPDFLFLSEKHQTALDLLELAIFNSSGFCVISGEIGAGKTTLIRELLNRLDETINVGLISNTHESFGELLQWVMAAYGLPMGSSDKLELHRRFIDYTIEQYAKNKHTLLIVDEAQNLSMSALEELRMLSNVNSDKDLVLQVILVGQQQLRDKLKNPQLEQFSQRIALDYHLETLNEEETRRYIQHRLQRAGGRGDLFTDSACIVVYRVTHGIPRLINRVCDLSLVYGYSKESPRISAEVVEQVAEDQRMGRLFGDQAIPDEQAIPGEKDIQQPVTLKAVASGYGATAEPAMVRAPSDFIEAKLDDVPPVTGAPVEGDDIPAPDSVLVAEAADTTPVEPEPKENSMETQGRSETASEPVESNKHTESDPLDASVTASTYQAEEVEKADVSDLEAMASAAADKSEAEKCEPVHTLNDKGGLPSEAPEEAKEPQVTEEHPAPMNDKIPIPANAGNVMSGKSEAIVDAMSSILLPETQSVRATAADVQAEKSQSEMADELHTLIVNAEKNQRAKGERGALWLLVGVAVMVVGTGWMARDIWLDQMAPAEQQVSVESELIPIQREPAPVTTRVPVAVVEPEEEPVAQTQVAVSGNDQTEVTAPVAVPADLPDPETATAQAPAPVVEVTAALESGKRLVRQDDGSLVETETVKPTVDPLAQDAELQREAERLARLQEEAQRLEDERKAAERKLAKQRAARQALERKARLEQQRIRAARKAVDKVAVDRARVEQQLNQVTQTKPVVVEARPAPVVPQAKPAVEQGDEHQASADTVAVLESAEVENEVVPEGDIKFSNNPCNGPTAKFMSTCR